MTRRRVPHLAAMIAAAALLACAAALLAASHEVGAAFPRQAEPEALSGVINVVWGAPAWGQSAPEHPAVYVLTDARGQKTELSLDESSVRRAGGPQALDGERVEVEGTGLPGDRVRVESIRAYQHERAAGTTPAATPAAPSSASAVVGSKPAATILCRFGDSTGVTPHPPSWYETMMGGSEPGLAHYWRQLSYGAMDLAGSRVLGWYNLPHPKSYYLVDDPRSSPSEYLDRLAEDCTAAADADVHFPDFTTVNLVVDEWLGDGYTRGGSWYMTLDGRTKSWGTTWLPSSHAEHQWIIAHEMGHSYGLPHSSSPHVGEYGSLWDVMSEGWCDCPPHPQFGLVAVGTISYHKDMMGWIPPGRKYEADYGANPTVALERLEAPASDTGYLMAQIPIGGSATRFYTVEARRFAGYDRHLPGEAVIIHEVGAGGSQVRVVDSDADLDRDPNDESAMWTPGETFADAATGISVEVTGETAGGYTVRIDGGVDVADPNIVNVRPAAGSRVRDRTPTISALVGDDTELARTDVRLYVDGRPKPFSYAPATDRLSHATGRLSYGRHHVRITAEDTAGNRAVRAWSFRVARKR